MNCIKRCLVMNDNVGIVWTEDELTPYLEWADDALQSAKREWVKILATNLIDFFVEEHVPRKSGTLADSAKEGWVIVDSLESVGLTIRWSGDENPIRWKEFMPDKDYARFQEVNEKYGKKYATKGVTEYKSSGEAGEDVSELLRRLLFK